VDGSDLGAERDRARERVISTGLEVCCVRIGAKGVSHGSGWLGKSTLASALGRIRLAIFSSDSGEERKRALPAPSLYTRGGPAVRRRLYSKAIDKKDLHRAVAGKCRKTEVQGERS